MNDDRTTNGDEAANNEPALTEQNSRTIRGEDDLAGDTIAVESNVEGLDDQTTTRSGGATTPGSRGVDSE